MKQLFTNPETQEIAFSKFEKLFDRHESGNILNKAAELYLTFLEEENLQLDIDSIIELGEDYGFDLNKLQSEIDYIK